MNNSNYGYSPSAYLPPYSSTPTGIRTQRPRFGYSGPTLYPRPRSSASKPNPDSFSDSMINNYGSSTSRIDTSFSSENGNDGYDSSKYFSANESFYSQNQSYSDSSMIKSSPMRYENPNMVGDNSLVYGDMKNSGLLNAPPKYPFNFIAGVNTEYQGNFPKNSTFGFGNKRPRKFIKAKKMATQQSAWRCDLCSIDFTSQIPYDMHLQGAKHAKKMKAEQALSSIELQVFKGPEGDKTFFCAMCNVRANSSLQLQTHLEGTKHKNKLQTKEPKDPSQNSSKETPKTETDNSLNGNGKTNGSLVRSLPSDFGDPQPSKLTKFACDVCNITVNSDVQLQQHLSSKKHNNKIEGKPPTFRVKKFKQEKKTAETPVSDGVENIESEPASTEKAAKIVGVKTLASSFVLGETLQ